MSLKTCFEPDVKILACGRVNLEMAKRTGAKGERKNPANSFSPLEIERIPELTDRKVQYCAKVMRANFDEFRVLFLRIFDDMSAKFRAVFRVAQCDISKKKRRNYANSFEISK